MTLADRAERVAEQYRTYSEAADSLGISAQQLRRIRQGKTQSSKSVRKKIRRREHYFGVGLREGRQGDRPERFRPRPPGAGPGEPIEEEEEDEKYDDGDGTKRPKGTRELSSYTEGGLEATPKRRKDPEKGFYSMAQFAHDYPGGQRMVRDAAKGIGISMTFSALIVGQPYPEEKHVVIWLDADPSSGPHELAEDFLSGYWIELRAFLDDLDDSAVPVAVY